MAGLATSGISPAFPLDRRPHAFGIGRFEFLMTLMLVGSMGVNVVLARKVESLRSTIKYIKNEGALKIGSSLPPLRAAQLDGALTTVRFDDTPTATVLYVFTPGCSWCTKNLDSIRTLATSMSPRYRLIGLSLSREGLKDYIKKARLTFPVYTDIPPETRAGYRLGSTPETLLISREGKLTGLWLGAYMGDTKKAIEAQFGVSLPEIRLGS